MSAARSAHRDHKERGGCGIVVVQCHKYLKLNCAVYTPGGLCTCERIVQIELVHTNSVGSDCVVAVLSSIASIDLRLEDSLNLELAS